MSTRWTAQPDGSAALGAQRIPDPTTAGDFCRRFDEPAIEVLQAAINETRADPHCARGRITGDRLTLMARSFGFAVLHCTQCGGRFRLIALIEDSRVIRRILGHLGLPTAVPAARPPRAPPHPFRPCDDRLADDISAL
jgi:hypothetical protein